MYSDFSSQNQNEKNSKKPLNELINNIRMLRVDCALLQSAVEKRIRTSGICKRYTNVVEGQTSNSNCKCKRQKIAFNSIKGSFQQNSVRPFLLTKHRVTKIAKQPLILSRKHSLETPSISSGSSDNERVQPIEKETNDKLPTAANCYMPKFADKNPLAPPHSISYNSNKDTRKSKSLTSHESRQNKKRDLLKKENSFSIFSETLLLKKENTKYMGSHEEQSMPKDTKPYTFRSTSLFNLANYEVDKALSIQQSGLFIELPSKSSKLYDFKKMKFWLPTYTIPKPFQFNNRKKIECYYSKKFLHKLLEEKRLKEEHELKKSQKPFKANSVPISTYVPHNDLYVGRLKRSRSLNLPSKQSRDKNKDKKVLEETKKPFHHNPVPSSTFVQPKFFDNERRKQHRKERAIELLRSSSEPRGMMEHSEKWHVQNKISHSQRCLATSISKSKRFATSVPEFRLLHRQFQNNLKESALKLPVTFVEPFKFSKNTPEHYCWNWTRKSFAMLQQQRTSRKKILKTNK